LMLSVVIAALFILPAGAFAEIKLTVAEIHPEDYPTTKGLFKFAELVKEKSGGEIVVDVKFGGVLGKGEAQVVEQVQFGALDMARISVSPMTEFVPALEAFGLPYIWKSQDSMWKVLKGEIGAELLKEVENHNFYGLCYYEAGARSFYNSQKEITSVADLKGMKIRVQSSQLMIDLVNTLGANATPMAFGEVYDGISKGVLDGAENNWPSLESTGHFEVAPFYTLDMHTRVPEILIASKMAFDKKLSPEQIALVMEAAKETEDYVIEKWNERVEASKKIVLDGGTTVTELTPEAFQGFVDAVQPLYEKYGAKHSAIIEKIRAAQ
jgi:tripartite ATP-independent transporter DctP family solute receptor